MPFPRRRTAPSSAGVSSLPYEPIDASGLDELDEFLAEREESSSFRDAQADVRQRADLVCMLVRHRHGKKVTQSAVAARMGTTQSAVSELEGGATDPRLSTLLRYARALDLSLKVRVQEPQFGRGEMPVTHVFERASAKPQLPAMTTERVEVRDRWLEKGQRLVAVG